MADRYAEHHAAVVVALGTESVGAAMARLDAAVADADGNPVFLIVERPDGWTVLRREESVPAPTTPEEPSNA